MKKCKTCKEDKAITAYPKDRRSPTGHSGRICTSCLNAKNRQKNNKVSVEEKNCRTCKQTKTSSEFQRDKKMSDGLQANCKECRNAKKRKAWHENKDHNSKVCRKYRERNRDRINKAKRKAYYSNRESILERQKEYVERNKAAVAEYRRRHYIENKHIYIMNSRIREKKLNTGINIQFVDRIKEIYNMSTALTESTATPHQVDHIIPLTHKKVCGLHVPWNLQILTEDENRSKKNKFDGTYDNESWR